MGNQYNDEDGFDFEDGANDGRGGMAEVRSAYEKLKKAKEKVEQELNTLKAESSKRALTDVLRERELNPALSKFMISDGVDGSSKESVDEWLSENGSLFGYTPKTPEQSAPDERAAAFAAMANSQANALPLESKIAELDRRMDAAKTPEEVNAILAEAGPLLNA